MRGIKTPVTQYRHKVFTEVAKVAFESENINNDIEAIPYKLINGDEPSYRESIYRESAGARSRESR